MNNWNAIKAYQKAAGTHMGAQMDAISFASPADTAAAKATLALAGLTVRVATVVRAKVAGAAGNSITVALTPGSAQNAGTLDESAFPAVVFNYKTGVTTVTNFETALAAATNVEVGTAGTGANLITATGDTVVATAMSGGFDTETGALGSYANHSMTARVTDSLGNAWVATSANASANQTITGTLTGGSSGFRPELRPLDATLVGAGTKNVGD